MTKTQIIEPLHDGSTQVMPGVSPPTIHQLKLLSTIEPDQRSRQPQPCNCWIPVIISLLTQVVIGEAILFWLVWAHKLTIHMGQPGAWVLTIR